MMVSLASGAYKPDEKWQKLFGGVRPQNFQQSLTIQY